MLHNNARVARICFAGDIDLARKEEFNNALVPAESADVAILDLCNVTYMDTTVLNGLVVLKKRMLHHGSRGIVRIAVGNPFMRRLFLLCKLDRIFELYTSVEEAREPNSN